MPSLKRDLEVTCENCGTQTTSLDLALQRKSCSAGNLYCIQCPNFSTKSKTDLNYHIAKQHSAAGPKNDHTFKEYSIEFPSFYSVRHHKQRYYTAGTISSGKEVDMQSLANAGDDKSWEEELHSCRHFLVDSEIQKGDIACSILLSTT